MKALRLLAITLGVAVVAALAWLVGGNAYALHREKQVEADWVRSFGTLQQRLDRYPKTTTNDTARHLERLGQSVGIDLTPKTIDAITQTAVASTNQTESDVERGRQAASRYVRAEVEKPDSRIERPPAEVVAFLSAQAQNLEAIEVELISSPAPTWNFDPSYFSYLKPQPIPDTLALLRLQRILLAKALRETADEDIVAAGRTLEASWKLNREFRRIPDESCQIIALAIARLQVGALRKVDVDAELWRKRLGEYDFKRSNFDTQMLHLWPRPARYRQLEEIENRKEKSTLKRLKNGFEEPYSDIVWSEALDKMRLAYLKIQKAPVMARDLWDETHGPEKNASEILVAIQMPNLVDCFKRVDRLIIESELTDKILQARQLRRENNLKWPPSVPGVEATRFPDAKWIYAVSPDGTMSLSLSKEPHWNASGLVLPSRFTAS